MDIESVTDSIPAFQCPDPNRLVALLETPDTCDTLLIEHVNTCVDCQLELDRISDSAALSEYRAYTLDSKIADHVLGPPRAVGELGTINELSILSRIGQGGMGVVYRGRDEALGREVAVKVLTNESNPTAVKRFIREAKAAANLNHENIVPVYFSGSSKDGRPFLVMPLIEGESLRQRVTKDVAASKPIDVKANVELIRQVASGLEAAHSVGMIHRDVKPGNIMLDKQGGKAKLTDFGLVRSLSDNTLTQTNMLCGTPEYMSPEQIDSPDSIDSRSDVYSLGVTFYECLTGAAPFRGRPLDILEQHRSNDPLPLTRLNRLVPSDVETICLKAIAKEPGQRYQSAGELSEDLQRWLANKPILARRQSSFTRAKFFMKRNRGLVASAMMIAALLVAGITTSTWFGLSANNAKAESDKHAADAIEARDETRLALKDVEKARDAATASAKSAKNVLQVFIDSFDSTNVQNGANKDMLAKDVLFLAKKNIDENIEDTAEEKFALLKSLSEALIGLGETELALEAAEESTALCTELLDESHPDTMDHKANLCLALRMAGQFDRAELLLNETIALCTKHLGDDHPITLRCLTELGAIRMALGDFPGAVKYGRESVEAHAEIYGEDDPNTLVAKDWLASGLRKNGNLEEALKVQQYTLDVRKAKNGMNDAGTLESLTNMALLTLDKGDTRAAIEMFRESLAISKSVFGDEHPKTIKETVNLSFALREGGEYDEAVEVSTPAYALCVEVMGDEHPDTLGVMDLHSTNLQQAGKPEEALVVKELAIEVMRRTLGDQHVSTLIAMANLATIYNSLDRYDDAVELADEVHKSLNDVVGPQHQLTLVMGGNLAAFLDAAGRTEESMLLHKQTFETMKKINGLEHPSTLLSMSNLGDSLRQLGKFDEAIPLLVEAAKLHAKVQGAEHPQAMIALHEVGDVYREAQRWSEAIAAYEKAVEMRTKVLGATDKLTLFSKHYLAISQSNGGNVKQSIDTNRETYLARVEVLGEDDRATLLTLGNLAFNLVLSDELPEAATHYRTLYERLSEQEASSANALGALSQLAFVESRMGKFEDAKRSCTSWLEQFDAETIGSRDRMFTMLTLAEVEFELGDSDSAMALADEITASKDAMSFQLARAKMVLGRALATKDQFDDAEEKLLEAIKLHEQSLPDMSQIDRWYVTKALNHVIEFFESQEKPDEADAWRKKLDRLNARN